MQIAFTSKQLLESFPDYFDKVAQLDCQALPDRVIQALGAIELPQDKWDDWMSSNEVTYPMYAKTKEQKIGVVMQYLDRELQFHGVEAIPGENEWDDYWGDILALYLNSGDTYWITIIVDLKKDRFVLTTYGDFVEELEQEALGYV